MSYCKNEIDVMYYILCINLITLSQIAGLYLEFLLKGMPLICVCKTAVQVTDSKLTFKCVIQGAY